MNALLDFIAKELPDEGSVVIRKDVVRKIITVKFAVPGPHGLGVSFFDVAPEFVRDADSEAFIMECVTRALKELETLFKQAGAQSKITIL